MLEVVFNHSYFDFLIKILWQIFVYYVNDIDALSSHLDR